MDNLWKCMHKHTHTHKDKLSPPGGVEGHRNVFACCRPFLCCRANLLFDSLRFSCQCSLFKSSPVKRIRSHFLIQGGSVCRRSDLSSGCSMTPSQTCLLSRCCSFSLCFFVVLSVCLSWFLTFCGCVCVCACYLCRQHCWSDNLNESTYTHTHTQRAEGSVAMETSRSSAASAAMEENFD